MHGAVWYRIVLLLTPLSLCHNYKSCQPQATDVDMTNPWATSILSLQREFFSSIAGIVLCWGWDTTGRSRPVGSGACERSGSGQRCVGTAPCVFQKREIPARSAGEQLEMRSI